MNKLLITIICLFSYSLLFAQIEKFQFATQLEQTYTLINADKLGNIYACDGSILYKFSQTGELLCSYSAYFSGKIENFDTYNPMKILIFSKDFTQITFVDNKLAHQHNQSILSDNNLHIPMCVCSSYDNGFWVYDDGYNQIFRFNANGQIQNNSSAFSTIWDKKVCPTQIFEDLSGKLIAYDSLNGFFLFDQFGTFIKNVPILHLSHISIYQQYVVFIQDNLLHFHNLDTLQDYTSPLPNEDVEQIHIQNNVMVTLDKLGIVRIYTAKN